MTYNLGPGTQHSILEYAITANEIGCQFGFKPVRVHVEDKGKEFAICMNCDKLTSTTSWVPRIGKDQMVTRLFQLKKNE